jgi:hypothetical protein
MRAARLITGARSVLQTFLPDRDLTVTGANVCERQETPSLENCLKQAAF